MLRTIRIALAGALVIGSLATPLSAQDDETLAWVQLAVVDVDPTMVAEFIAVQRDLAEYSKKQKVPWRVVSRTAVFGDTYRFLVSTPAPNLASFADADDRDVEMNALISRAERCIRARKVYAVRLLPEYSNPREEPEPGLAVVNIATIAPGREQEYIDLMSADFFPHFKDAEMHFDTGAVAIGGEGGFIHVFHVDDFAELDEGSPAMRGLSAEGAQQATAKLSGIVTRSELWITRVIEEVSYMALPEASENR